nr:hypothetical protein [Tanacetum cinerariifolium]
MVNIKESSIRRTLRLDDAEGISCLTNTAIFEGLARMGAKTTSWNEFNSTMASAIICLATNQKFNFSRRWVFSKLIHNQYPSPLNHQLLNPKKHKPKRKQTQEPEVPTTESPTKHNLPLPSHDPLPSGEDSLKLKELIDLYTNLSNKVLDLESEVIDIKSTYQARIEKLETRVERLEEENRNAVIEQVKRSERLTDAIMKYQALKRKPLTEAQARRNMIMYLKNMAGYKMNYFNGMRYDEIRPLFEKHYNYNQVFLDEMNKGFKVSEKEHLRIVPDGDDDVYTDATPLASKIPIVDYKIHTERNRPYFKIIRAGGNHMLFISLNTMMKNFNREDLESLWKIIRERFEKTEPKNYSDDYLLNTLKIMFEKPNVEASVWEDQKGKYGLAKVKS